MDQHTNKMIIQKEYLTYESKKKLQHAFYANDQLPSITLHNFFDDHFYQRIRKEIVKLSFRRITQLNSHLYHRAALPHKLSRFLNSKAFLYFISGVIGKKVRGITAEVLSFSWKDYIILGTTMDNQPGFDVILDFTDTWNEEWGGLLTYADRSLEISYPVDKLPKDATRNFFPIPASANILTITQKKKTMNKFMQYINHYAGKKKRYMVIGKVR